MPWTKRRLRGILHGYVSLEPSIFVLLKLYALLLSDKTLTQTRGFVVERRSPFHRQLKPFLRHWVTSWKSIRRTSITPSLRPATLPLGVHKVSSSGMRTPRAFEEILHHIDGLSGNYSPRKLLNEPPRKELSLPCLELQQEYINPILDQQAKRLRHRIHHPWLQRRAHLKSQRS